MPSPNISNSVLLEKINTILSEMAELKSSVKCLEKGQSQFEKTYVAAHAELVSEVSAHDKRIIKIEGDLASLQDMVKPLIFAHKILVWVAVCFGSSIIALIWGLLTNQVTLGFGG